MRWRASTDIPGRVRIRCFKRLRLRCVEDADAIAAAALSFIHCRVRLANDCARSDFRIIGNDPAEAGRNRKNVLADTNRGLEGLDKASANFGDVIAGREICAQDNELVTTEASNGIGGPGLLLQAFSHSDQSLVPNLVAAAVVDLFETVEIEEQESYPALMSTATLEGLFQPVG